MVLTAIARASETFEEFGKSQIERAVPVGRRSLSADDRPLVDDGDLDALGRLGLRRVGLVREFYVDALRPRCELFDLAEFVSDVFAETV